MANSTKNSASQANHGISFSKVNITTREPQFIYLFLTLFLSFNQNKHKKYKMRPTEFSNEEIIKAGTELLAAGRNVTGFALRQRVGGGSAPRLKQVWDEHINSRSVMAAEQMAELPVEVEDQLKTVTDALVERLRLLTVELNKHAVIASERRVSEIVRATREQLAQAERELADASMTVDELEKKLRAVKDETVNLDLLLAHVTQTSEQQAAELAQLKERLLAAESAARLSDERYQVEHNRANEAREKASRLEGQVEVLEKLLANK